MRTKALLLLALPFLLLGCSKEDRIRRKMAGVYEVYKYQIDYYGADGTIDSSYVRENVGQVGLYDNAHYAYNNTANALVGTPRGWFDNFVGGGLAVRWYPDEVAGRTITFFIEHDYGMNYVIYTVNGKAGKKETWTYVEPNPMTSGIAYKETMYVRKR